MQVRPQFTNTHTHTLERPSFDSHLLVIMEQAPKFLESRSQIRGNQSIIRVKSCDQIEINQRNQLGCLFDSTTWKKSSLLLTRNHCSVDIDLLKLNKDRSIKSSFMMGNPSNHMETPRPANHRITTGP